MQEPIKKTDSSVVYYENSSLFINNHSAFLFKKIEKIVAALYMITEFFSTQEPLKWNIRKVSNDVIKDTLILTKIPTSLTSKTLRNVHGRFLEIASYVSLGHVTGLISSMNFTILNSEIEKISQDLESEIKRHPDIKETIRQDFFTVTNPQEKSYKGHQPIIKDTVKDIVNQGTSDLPTINREQSLVRESKTKNSDGTLSNDARRSKIIDIIKEKGRVSIKDIVYQIPKCSSKTIQRDLVKLIEDGFVSKEGDRRWSIYFLKP